MAGRGGGALALGVMMGLLPLVAAAQTSEPHLYSHEPRLAAGGEISVIASPREDDGFFNNTDYDVNGLRAARLRLFAEWRATSRLSVVGEIRSDNGTRQITPAAYVRWRPRADGNLVVQAGRIPPVFGAFSRHPYGRDNLTLGQPLAYQYLTSLRPDAVPATTDDLLQMRGRGWEPNFPVGSTEVRGGIPLVSVATWDTGVEALWQRGPIELAAALTRGASAVPVVRETNGGVSVSGRVAFLGPAGLTVGVSGARGRWLDDSVLDLTPLGRSQPATQSVLGADAEFGSGPWLVRGEWMRTVFELPVAAAAVTARLTARAAFAESRYRLHPRWQVAARVDRLDFGTILGTSITSVPTPWDAPVTRVEGVLGFRATRALEVRAGWQQNWRDGGRVRRLGLPAVSVLYWF
jgi:hypothetical protein